MNYLSLKRIECFDTKWVLYVKIGFNRLQDSWPHRCVCLVVRLSAKLKKDKKVDILQFFLESWYDVFCLQAWRRYELFHIHKLSWLLKFITLRPRYFLFFFQFSIEIFLKETTCVHEQSAFNSLWILHNYRSVWLS